MEYDLLGRMNLVFETSGHRAYERYFKNEYLRIAASTVKNPDRPTITVKIVNQLPPKEAGDLKRSILCKNLFTFHYVIRGIDSDNVRIYFRRHFIDKIYINAIAVFLQAQLLEPIMYLKLLQNKILLMHAGGVCDSEGGYLLPAYGGTGKTTLSIALVGYGYKLLGDDLLIIDIESGKVFPYARPLHLFTYNIRNLHGARVPLKYQIAIYCKNVLRFFLEGALRTEFLISTRVHADEILDHDPFGTAVPYKGIYFLVKEGAAISIRKVEKSNSGALAQEVMESADLNSSLYALLEDDGRVAPVMRLEKHLIQRLLEQIGEIVYVNTRKLDLSNLRPFIGDHFRGARFPLKE